MLTRLLLAVLALLAGWAVFDYLRALNLPAPAVLAAPAAPAVAARPAASAPARRVVWILVDGLRLDAARTMPTVSRLAAAGRDFDGTCGFPTYSLPNYITQAAGLDPADSGARTNGFPSRVALDSVFRAVHEARLGVGIVGTDTRWWERLFGPLVDVGWIEDEPDAEPPGALSILHLDYPDHEAHAHGSAGLPYRNAVRRADAVIARIAARLDPARDALVISSDHGHIPRGGHGGAEMVTVRIPIVLWGAGIRHQPVRGRAEGRDIGPTIAALLGLPPLAQASGRSLVGESAGALERRRVIERTLDGFRAGRPGRLARARTSALALLLVVAGVLAAAAAHAHPGRRAWLAAPIYLVVLAGLYALTDTVSFSTCNEQEPFMARFAGLASAAAIVQMILGGRRSALPATLLALLPVAVALWVAPERPVFDLPSPALTFFPVLAYGALCVMAGWATFWAKLKT